MVEARFSGGAQRRSDGAQRLSTGFSLLLPVYAGDNAEFFKLAFESSTSEQTMPPSEVVLVQDGPVGDDLALAIEEVRKSSRVPVNYVELKENRGLTQALNTGLMASSFNIIARMDADDVSLSERFEKQWELMEEGYDLVGSGMVEFNDDPNVTGSTRVPPVGQQRIRDHARTHNPFNHPTVMYRLDALERVGAYEPFGKMEDYWLWVRIISSGARVENIAEPLVKYRVGSGAFERRGGFREALTEIKLQNRLRRIGFITFGEYLRNVVMKGAYRILPAAIKKRLFAKLIADGLPSDRAGNK